MKASSNPPSNAHQHLDHLFSCENSKPIQEWIMSAHAPSALIENIEDMNRSLVDDLVTLSSVVRPAASFVFCGWVCHDVSLSNMTVLFDHIFF